MTSSTFGADLAASYGNESRFSELVFGTALHAGQRRYCANARADVNFLLPGNSWGKTEFIARKVLYDAWYKDGPYRPTNLEDWLSQEYKALVASYNYDIAKESFDRLLHYHRSREELQHLIKRINRSDPVQIELVNGAIIDWGSLKDDGKLVEAARRRVVYVDEAGHIPDLSSTFDNILFPRTMGVGGRIHLFGTPKPHSDPYLLEVYEKGRDGRDPFYYSQSGSVFENEFWSDTERERVLANPRYVVGWEACPHGGCELYECRDAEHPILTPVGRQVIRGEFVLAGGFFFSRPHIRRMFTGDYPVKWHGDRYFTTEPQPGHLYLGAYDLGGNRKKRKGKKGSDATVGFVIDYTKRPWRIVHYEYIEGGDADWEIKYQQMADTFNKFNMPYLLIDATGQIDSVQEALQLRGVEVEGVHFGGTGNKKYDMLRNLQLALELQKDGETGYLRSVPIERLQYELEHYILPDDDIVQDHVMSLAMLAHHIVQWELPPAYAGEVW